MGVMVWNVVKTIQSGTYAPVRIPTATAQPTMSAA